LDNVEKTKVQPISIAVVPTSFEIKLESVSESMRGKFRFRSEAAEKAFNYLVAAFEEDHLKLGFSEEISGWRTLMEVVKKGHVSKHSMYGQSGRGGEAIEELRNSGLVESRLFLGERSRGGRLLRIRMRHQKESL